MAARTAARRGRRKFGSRRAMSRDVAARGRARRPPGGFVNRRAEDRGRKFGAGVGLQERKRLGQERLGIDLDGDGRPVEEDAAPPGLDAGGGSVEIGFAVQVHARLFSPSPLVGEGRVRGSWQGSTSLLLVTLTRPSATLSHQGRGVKMMDGRPWPSRKVAARAGGVNNIRLAMARRVPEPTAPAPAFVRGGCGDPPRISTWRFACDVLPCRRAGHTLNWPPSSRRWGGAWKKVFWRWCRRGPSGCSSCSSACASAVS